MIEQSPLRPRADSVLLLPWSGGGGAGAWRESSRDKREDVSHSISPSRPALLLLPFVSGIPTPAAVGAVAALLLPFLPSQAARTPPKRPKSIALFSAAVRAGLVFSKWAPMRPVSRQPDHLGPYTSQSTLPTSPFFHICSRLGLGQTDKVLPFAFLPLPTPRLICSSCKAQGIGCCFANRNFE